MKKAAGLSPIEFDVERFDPANDEAGFAEKLLRPAGVVVGIPVRRQIV